MTMAVRKATASDEAALGDLCEEVDVLHAAARPDAFQTAPSMGRAAAVLREHLNAPDATMLVAELDGEVVGFASAKLGRPPSDAFHRPRLFAYVEELVVSKAHRRHGLGRALIEEIETWARGRNVDQIELIVWEFNEDARLFYEELGYRTSYRRMFK